MNRKVSRVKRITFDLTRYGTRDTNDEFRNG